MKPVLMILVYLLVVLLPMILSWAMGYPSRPFRHELASGAGMLAFAMILAEFVLSGRFRSVSRGVGLDVTIRFHQLMARTALVLALVHPFLYRNITGPHRPWDVTRQLTITSDFAALATGVAAFVLLPTLVLIAIGRSQLDYKYETWRLMHGLGALLIAGLLLHHAVYAGRYSGDPVMTGLWLAMTGVAVLSLAIVYVFKPLAQLRRPWRVTRVERITPKQWALSIAPDGHDGIAYKAGQFVWLNVGHGSFSLYENPFSLSSAPSDGPNLSFLIKELGDFTGNLGQIAPGARAYIDGPHGTLTVAGRKEPGIALIAGGVGIAPSLGILREMRRSGDTRQAVLVYGNRAEDQIVLRDELEGYARDGIARVVNVLQEPPEGWAEETGVIDAALIGRLFSAEQMQSWLFVLCGPPQMITTVEQALIAGGAPASRILSERFQPD